MLHIKTFVIRKETVQSSLPYIALDISLHFIQSVERFIVKFASTQMPGQRWLPLIGWIDTPPESTLTLASDWLNWHTPRINLDLGFHQGMLRALCKHSQHLVFKDKYNKYNTRTVF